MQTVDDLDMDGRQARTLHDFGPDGPLEPKESGIIDVMSTRLEIHTNPIDEQTRFD